MGPMLRAYLETALWSSNDRLGDDGRPCVDGDAHAAEECDCEDRPLDELFDLPDLDPAFVAQAAADCAAFEAAHEDAWMHEDAPESRDCNQAGIHGVNAVLSLAGHDLWLTRNGHGAGFWDGDWPDPWGDKLSEAARKLGEINLYVGDDGVIYSM